MSWLFPGQEVQVDTHCLDCGETIRIRIRMRDDSLLEATPEAAVGYMTSPSSRPTGTLQRARGQTDWKRIPGPFRQPGARYSLRGVHVLKGAPDEWELHAALI